MVPPPPGCPGPSASQQARRRNTSVRSDGLTVIRVAAFGQHNTGQNVSLALQSCPILDSFEITCPVSDNVKDQRLLKSTNYFLKLIFVYVFWKRRRNQIRLELSHVAMNRVCV